MTVQENWIKVQDNIIQACRRSSRQPEEIKVVAVTKYVDIPRMREALDAGLVHLGESKAQDAVSKWHTLHGEGIWHFIGHLQTNKVKDVVDKCTYIHSLDRLSLAQEIHKRASKLERVISCFVQVNVSGEDTKHGLAMEQVEDFIQSLQDFSSIRVVGLMTMAPFVDDVEQARPVFRELHHLQRALQAKNWDHAPLQELSMGMSNDYEVAIEEGATFIRLGSTLVGMDGNG